MISLKEDELDLICWVQKENIWKPNLTLIAAVVFLGQNWATVDFDSDQKNVIWDVNKNGDRWIGEC